MTLQTSADDGSASWQVAQYYGWGVSGLRQAWTPQDGEIDYAFDPQGNVCSRYTDTRRRTEGGSGWGVARVYDAYGQLRFGDRGEAQSDAVGYNGQWGYYTDIASLAASGNGLGSEAAQAGLVLCTYRYYSPDLARWLTRDPLGYDGGINVYAYCEDNPIGNADPSGLDWLDDLSNFSAGWGDALTFGATKIGRKYAGQAAGVGDANQAVNYNSGCYYAGEVVGTIHQQALLTLGLQARAVSLIKRLIAQGIKINPDKLVWIIKTASGRIVWLEEGTQKAGLAHILYRHAADFANKGINVADIPALIAKAIKVGKIVGYQGQGVGRPIYEVFFNGKIIRVAITIGANGFVVGANPL